MSVSATAVHCVSVNERRSSRTRAGGEERNTRNTYTRTLEPALSSVYGTRVYYNIHVSSCVHYNIGNYSCRQRGVLQHTRGGGDDRRRSYCIYIIYRYTLVYLVYTYADLWALVVPSSVSRLIEYTCTCSPTTTTTRKQTATGSFFPTSSSSSELANSLSNGAAAVHTSVCAPDGPLTVTPRTRRIIIYYIIIEVYYNKFIVACSCTPSTYMV